MESASPTSSSAGATPSFSLFYVLIGCAALLGCVVFPIAFLFVLRRFRQQQPPLGYQLPVSLGDNVEGKPQQGEPKLFDVYVKPGLEVHEPRFEYIQVSQPPFPRAGGPQAYACLAGGRSGSSPYHQSFVIPPKCAAHAPSIRRSEQEG